MVSEHPPSQESWNRTSFVYAIPYGLGLSLILIGTTVLMTISYPSIGLAALLIPSVFGMTLGFFFFRWVVRREGHRRGPLTRRMQRDLLAYAILWAWGFLILILSLLAGQFVYTYPTLGTVVLAFLVPALEPDPKNPLPGRNRVQRS